MRTVCFVLVIALAACSQTVDPCPPGQRASRSEDRCIPSGRDVEASTAEVPDAEMPDIVAGDELDAGLHDAELHDAGTSPEADAAFDAQLPDTAIEPVDSGQDATQLTPDASGPICSQQDLSRWAAGHTKPGLVALISACYGACKEDAACADKCVHDEVGLEGCTTCTSAQSACSSKLCGAACTVSMSDPMCLSCLCEADCVGIFERCAVAELSVCHADLIGRDASPEEYELSAPVLFRQKSVTGGMRAARLEVSNGQTWPTTWSYQFSTGFDTLHAFPLRGREYILHAKSQCGVDPCIARISPVLRDGSFGHPVYDQPWTRGHDQIETFTVGGDSYLLRYKSGNRASDGDPAGSVWIDRLATDDALTTLSLTNAIRTSWLTSTQQPYAAIAPFQMAGATYIMLHAADSTGETLLLRVLGDGGALRLEPVGAPFSLPGVDVLEMLKVGADWLLFTYQNAAGTPASGTARLFELALKQAGELTIGGAVYEAVWPERVTHAVGYAQGADGLLITHDSSSGKTNQHTLAADESLWAATFGTVTAKLSAGSNPPWNVLEVARQGKW